MSIHSPRFWKTVGISLLLAIFGLVLVIGTRRTASRPALRPKASAILSSPSAPEPTRVIDRGSLAQSSQRRPPATDAGTPQHQLLDSTSVNGPVTFAKPVSLALAHAAAEAFLASEKERVASVSPAPTDIASFNAMKATISGSNAISDTDGTTLAFVHTLMPAGFVVTAANSGIQPVVAFSFGNPFPFEDSARNVLLHLLKADMRARLDSLAAPTEAVAQAAQANKVQWARYEQVAPGK